MTIFQFFIPFFIAFICVWRLVTAVKEVASWEKTARQDCARGQEKTAAFPVLLVNFEGGIRQLLLTYTFFKESKEISSNLRNFFQSSKEICGTGSESPGEGGGQFLLTFVDKRFGRT